MKDMRLSNIRNICKLFIYICERCPIYAFCAKNFDDPPMYWEIDEEKDGEE